MKSPLIVAVVASLLLGCAESSSTVTTPSPTNGSSPSADAMTGTWTLVSIQPAGRPDQAAPAGATYTLTLTEGRLSTRVDCNTCSGTFALSGRTLTAGPAFACTRAACPTMAFENAYTGLLSGNSSVTLSQGTLVLSSERGVLRFTR